MNNLCRSCGKKIVWAVTENGKRIPLDDVAPTFTVRRVQLEKTGEYEDRAERSTARVSHFSTCKDANYWSKGKL